MSTRVSMKALRQYRRDNHLCIDCGEHNKQYPAWRCRSCADYFNEMQSLNRAYRVDRGYCIKCNSRLDRQGAYCSKCCRTIANEKARRKVG